MGTVLQHVQHFLTTASGIAMAVLLIGGAVWFARRILGWPWPIDFVSVFDEWIKPKQTTPHAKPTVNVEYRDAENNPMDLGSFVVVTMQNGRGKSVTLSNGVFADADPAAIKASARVRITVQDGLVRERLTVQLDDDAQTLFVMSKYTRARMIAEINRDATPLAPEPPTQAATEEHNLER